jgi:hypothetical protein
MPTTSRRARAVPSTADGRWGRWPWRPPEAVGRLRRHRPRPEQGFDCCGRSWAKSGPVHVKLVTPSSSAPGPMHNRWYLLSPGPVVERAGQGTEPSVTSGQGGSLLYQCPVSDYHLDP